MFAAFLLLVLLLLTIFARLLMDALYERQNKWQSFWYYAISVIYSYLFIATIVCAAFVVINTTQTLFT